jgi:hypothetical protein
MLTVKKGDDEIKRGRQKKGPFADVLWILETEQGLSRILDRKDIYISEFRIIHGLPQMEIANPGKLQERGRKFWVLN